jgi:carbon monoxide dehydrogenase subunit G
MKLEQSFEVIAPLGRVWEALIAVERVAPCLPGAAVTGRDPDGSYDGTFSVKIGPTTASYAGKLKLEQADETAHTATIQANGTDRRGQGGARATIASSLHPADGGTTRVEVVTDYQITGRLARFGRGGMIEDVAERLLKEFAQRLQESLATEKGEPASASAAGAPAGAAGAPALAGVSAAAGEAAAAPAGTSAAAGEAAAAPAGTPAAAGEAAAATREAPGAATMAMAPSTDPTRPTSVPAEPLHGGSLIASVLWDRARRNPPALVAVLAGLLVVLALARRGRR